MDNIFCFSKKLGFGVFLVHPTVVSVLLSASSREMLCLPYAGFFLSPCSFFARVLALVRNIRER